MIKLGLSICDEEDAENNLPPLESTPDVNTDAKMEEID